MARKEKSAPTTVRLRHKNPPASATRQDETFTTDTKGFVDAPEEAVDDLLAHGFERADA